MTVSFVVQLVDDRLRHGEVVGQAENVATREREVVTGVEALVAFFRRSGTDMEGMG